MGSARPRPPGSPSIRLNKYKNTSGPDISSYRNAVLGVIDIEQTLLDAAADGLIPSSGFDAIYTLPQPCSFILTNTFTF